MKPIILGLLLTLIAPARTLAQGNSGVASASTDAPQAAGNPASIKRAPDDVIQKLSELVHAGRYAEAQRVTAGLLLSYPGDPRLIKAKALLDPLRAAEGSTSAIAAGDLLATNTAASAQPPPSTEQGTLSGMDKVDYNALIELARQAQQTTDLSQQKTLLQQFMDQSSVFLQKHPNEMLLWELRAQSAISLRNLIAGYEAGQKLLAMGAADSNDPNAQHVLVELKNIGWLSKPTGGYLMATMVDFSKVLENAKPLPADQQALAKAYGVPSGQGVLIEEVIPNGPAAKAGLQRLDVIVRMDGQTVSSVRDLRDRTSQMAPGATVNLEIFRGGKKMKMTATLVGVS
jgi:hypothetical protein